jgi:polyisoprenyl-phosphate glycosyltransferase
MIELSIVIPCFNEEANVGELLRRVGSICVPLVEDYEIIFVDDGSRDNTLAVLRKLAEADRHVRVISFSRNFGHQAALTAGMDHACGRAVVVMDADLQHPPEMLGTFIEKWREGYEVVYAYRKKERPRLGYRIFNRLMQTEIPAEAADFRLTDQKVVRAFRQLQERSRFLRGMLAWLGFKQIGVPYQDDPRFAGQRAYTVRQTFRMAFHAILSFSRIPLRVASAMGLITLLLGLIYGLFILARFATGGTVAGWTGTAMTILILGGVQLLSLGVIAEYIGEIYDEVKRRPIYVVSHAIGFDQTGGPPCTSSGSPPAPGSSQM